MVGIDGPDPDTRSYVDELVQGDGRFSVIEYGENLGFYRNFERLLQLVPLETPWFALSDQDDVWDPDRLGFLVELLDSGPDVTGALGQALVTDRSGRVIGQTARRAQDLNTLLLKNEVTGSLLVASTCLLPRALPFPEETPAARHDHWLGVVATALGRIAVAPDPVQEYVQHERNAIGEHGPTVPAWGFAHWSQGRGILATLNSATAEMWGWRVSMARTLLLRVPAMTGPDRVTLEAIAGGRFSARLTRYLVRAVRSRAIPPDIAVGTVVAALWWPVAGRRFQG